ncbi:M56 family metallopeptidase [Clostridium arbusti]|uniref:M56 family metallopeptidase n=1 Tax=Clostridium arbusti TaxID=1137848 RepID=UPI000288FF64|nr:M56 family metallopeptidase [Clostridium arbusti]
MYGLTNFLYGLFGIVLQVSIISSIIIVLILAFNKFFKNKLGIKFQYAMWIIVIFRLLIPVLPESSFSIFNLPSNIDKIFYSFFTPKENNISSLILYSGEKVSHIYNTDSMLSSLTSINLDSTKAESFQWSIPMILAFIWMFGILIIGVYTFLVNMKFKNSLKKHSPFYNKKVLYMLEDCKKQMGINRHIPIITTPLIKSPSLMGYFKPIILLPENILKVLPVKKLRYVFLHELSHFKRKDIPINWIISILKIVYWFNPVIQHGLNKMREDMEICCDSLALSYTKDEEVKEYGYTILNLIENFSRPTKLLGATSIISNKNEVKRRIVMIKLFNKKSYRITAFAVGVLIIFGGITLTNAKTLTFTSSKAVNVDKIDYSFVNDPKLVGRWQSVDFVNDIQDFKVDTKNFKGDLYVKELNFTSDGKVSKTVFTWTKNHILNPVDKTDSSYVIKDIDGSTYIFFQWKSGDYTMRGVKPSYYVLKKISSTPSLNTNMQGEKVKIKTDKVDYPFVNDSEIIGSWKSVDFVGKIRDFKPNTQQWKGDLFINNLTFSENGAVNNTAFTWTKGLIINKNIKTASKYTIKEINGSKYMFFEWKNGDYVERGATPYYYVLEQVK